MKVKKPVKKSFFCTNLRINPELADKVKEKADAAKRSMNKEIELTLEEKYL
jgi:predicted HicB family RNase H-like nuclease